jgi:hypothetical protein
MDIGAILVGIALVIGGIAYVARPLFERSASGVRIRDAGGARRARLSHQRDAIYALIRELDTDHQTGKIAEQDYRSLRERYVTEGVSVLKQLDALPAADGRAALESEIEAQVLTLRRRQPAPQKSRHATAEHCTQCGHPADPEDRFCARCGAPLKGRPSR